MGDYLGRDGECGSIIASVRDCRASVPERSAPIGLVKSSEHEAKMMADPDASVCSGVAWRQFKRVLVKPRCDPDPIESRRRHVEHGEKSKIVCIETFGALLSRAFLAYPLDTHTH